MFLKNILFFHLHLMNQKFHRLVFPCIYLTFLHSLLQCLHRSCLLFLEFWHLFQWFVFQLQSLNHLSKLSYFGIQPFPLLGVLLLEVCPHHRCAGVLLKHLIGWNFSLQLTYDSNFFLQLLCKLVHFPLISTQSDPVLSLIFLNEVLQISDRLSQIVHLVLNGLRVVLLPCRRRIFVSS